MKHTARGSKLEARSRFQKADKYKNTMRTSQSTDGPGRYADVLLDTSFKRSFKEYGNAKRLMQLFLEALIPERKIASLTYTSEENTNQNIGKKSVRVDVECTDVNGERFVVEVQRARQSDFCDRAVYNSTFAVQRQLKEGDPYRFKPVYFIGIIRFSLTPEDGKCLHRYSLREDDSHKLMTDDLHYVFLDVTRCHTSEEAPLVEKIGYALNNMDKFDEKPAGLVGEFFDLLFNSADLSKFAPEDKIKYENDMTTERDIRNQIAYAREEGKAEGKAEERLSLAKKFKEQGFPSNAIAEATGLSVQEIEAL